MTQAALIHDRQIQWTSAAAETRAQLGWMATWLIDIGLFGGAIWTLCCNLSYHAGWSLETASLLFVMASGAAIAGFFFLRRRLGGKGEMVQESKCFLEFRRDILAAAIGVVCLLIWGFFFRTYFLYWLLAIPILIIGYMVEWQSPRRLTPVLDPPSANKWLLPLLIVAAVVATLVTNRPNPDDCYYLNRAAALADGFHQSMRTGFTLFEKSGLPFSYPSFPLIAFHDWIGFLSWVTGLQPLAVSAYIIAPVGAMLLMMAYSILCRRLFPQDWPWALAGVFAILVLGGPTMWHFANFGFSRIWQGKSLVLHVILPVTAAYGLRFGATGRRDDWLRLAAAATCAAGLSSISIWLVPAFTVLSVLGGIVRWRSMSLRLLLAIAACAYPLAEGLMARGGATQELGYRVENRSFEWILQSSFGGTDGALIWMAIILFAPMLALPSQSRRYLLVGVLGTLLTLMNPMLFHLVMTYVTSGIVFWRILWLLPPLPILAASLLLLGFGIPNLRWRRIAGPAVWFLFIVLFIGLALQRPTGLAFSPVQIGKPGLKVNQPEYATIALLMQKLSPGAPVMAPEDVGWMIPTFRHRLGAIAPRIEPVIQTIERQMHDSEDAALRYQSLRFAEGTEPVNPAALRHIVEHFALRGVVLRKGLPDIATVNQTLVPEGFVCLKSDPYVVWVRP